MFAIARSEMTQLVRNRLVAASSLFIPLAFSAVLIFNRENFGGTPVTAALILVTVTAMGTYITATTTLASRRQNLFLKRLRSTSAKDASILSGLVLPIALVNLVQAGVIVAILSVVGTPPVGVVAVVAAVVVLELMFVGAAIATAGLTNSPDHAQVTTLPLFVVALGASMWVGLTGTEELAGVKRLLPGGAVTELIIEGWSGMALHEAVSLLLPSLAFVVAAFAMAKSTFRWEPRT
ncbi:ABC transporter permease [Micrococcus luteus]|uniref:ABC transporter permease n=1 Tax=Micrococcus TaxID=1269 RepID=UPI00017266F7|nr:MULTISPECIES: ABC transporter permease [Micrococcus]EBV8528550.1 ABC transporter permease [Salmonella enterica subsp. enterica serovar Typhimurium]TFI17650.1 ABC transporter permease [Thiopseudomonas sp. 4R-3cl]AWD24736.1 ABC transporter permease [Micrococcus luteus]KYK01123.1 ABC transporter permease [Micrococcus sp. CH3]KYK04988.1 ABC transporter permease [Micrococcus sp. CH7]